jgi:hypothetical protein
MLGRALFAFVWLIIATGLVLPMYPPAVETTGSPSTDAMLQAAGSAPLECQDCPITDEGSGNCRSDCSCGQLLPAAYGPIEDTFTFRIRVIVGPRFLGPLSEVQPLPPKSPAI